MITGENSEDEIGYSDNLSVTVKANANGSLEQYFGLLLRTEPDGSSEVQIDTKHKYCALCLKAKVIKRYNLSTSSTNLRNHLRDKHDVVIEHKKSEKNQRLVSDMLTSIGQPAPALAVPTTSTLTSRRYILARQICLWFCRDFIPFNEISKPGIKDFFSWARLTKPNEELPNRKTLASSALNDIYTSLYNFVHKFAGTNLPKTIPIAFDFWSDNTRRISYITYWVHWIDSNWEMQKMCLKIAHFPHPHTGELIAEDFERLVYEYNLQNKNFMCVTDGGRNLIKACRVLCLQREGCLCHNLHLLISVDLIEKHPELKPIRDLIVRMKDITKSLVYKYDDLKKINDDDYNNRLYHILSSMENISEILESTNVNISDFDVEEDDKEMLNEFCNEQVRNSTHYSTIKNCNATRWNSVLTMFNSFAKNIDNINNCLASIKKYHKILSDTESKLCSDFITVLQVFEKATDVLQGDNNPTLNLAAVCYVEIRDSLNKLLADGNRSIIVEKSATFLLQNLDKRFKVTDNMIAATFLDPSAQSLPLIPEYLSKNGTDMVALLIKKWYEFDVELETSPTTKRKRQTPKKSMNQPTASTRLRFELIKKHTVNCVDVVDDSIENNIKREYGTYIQNCEIVDNPLEWWKKNARVYPYLSALAKVNLSIPASSGSTERHFSESGSLVTKKKAQLDPLTARKIMFIHDNLKYTQE